MVGRPKRAFTLDAEFIAAVDSFLEATGYTDRRLSTEALGGRHRFMWDVRRGMLPESPTKDRVLEFMAAKRAERSASPAEDAA